MSGPGTEAARAAAAGRRDAGRLRAALGRLGDACPPWWRMVAEARIARPSDSWDATGAACGVSGDAARRAAGRLLAAGSHRGTPPAGARCPYCLYLLTAPGHQDECGGGSP